MGFEDNPADEDEHGQCRYEIHRLEAELNERREEAKWIRRKLNLPEDCGFLTGRPTLAGEMHVVCSHAFGYTEYIQAYKCDDKQGRIARLEVQLREAQADVEKLKQLISAAKHLLLAATGPSEEPYHSEWIETRKRWMELI